MTAKTCGKGQIRQGGKCVAPYPNEGDTYKVQYEKDYPFKIDLIEGATVRNPAGIKTHFILQGVTLKYLSGAPDGTTWWEYKGKRMHYIGNGWCPMLYDNLRLVKRG